MEFHEAEQFLRRCSNWRTDIYAARRLIILLKTAQEFQRDISQPPVFYTDTSLSPLSNL
jgi:hypothetical protein